MVINFHCHVFPEAMAKKTIDYIISYAGTTAYTDGTVAGLLKDMQENDVKLSVALSVVTNPNSTWKINEFLSKVGENDGLLPFGGIHPDNGDFEEILDDIVSRGFKGIKLHPQYQKTDVCDPKYIRIVKAAAERNLIVLFHGGLDVGLPGLDLSAPSHTAKLLDTVPEAKVVMAHFGGWKQWDEVERLLVGRNVYFDIATSLTDDVISPEQAERIIRNHGSEKILFATDSPWSSTSETIARVNALDITDEDKENIFHRSAEKLLGL